MSVVAEGTREKLKVFISYSRQNLYFVDRLQAALHERNIAAGVDRTDIEKGEDWWRRIQQLISEADTIVFVLSPDSIGSPVCQREVDFAEQLKKRFVPIVAEDVASCRIPDAIARLNYIFFIPHTASGSTGSFSESMEQLVRALETDVAWIREHTRLGAQAQRWLDRGRRKELLLRGNELVTAESWIVARPETAPDPTDAHRLFLATSRRASTSRQRWLLGSVSAVAVGALALAGLAYQQSIIADTQRIKAETNQASAFTALAETRLPSNPADTIRLALASWPRSEASRLPKTALAFRLLMQAIPLQFERRVLRGHSKGILDLEISHDQTSLLTVSSDGTARLWNAENGESNGIIDPKAGPLFRAHFSPDGKKIITAGHDGVARIWDRATGRQESEVRPFGESLSEAVYSPDGALILIADQGNSASLWEAVTGRRITTLKGHTEAIRAASFSPDGARIVTVSGSWDRVTDPMVGLWDGKTGTNIALIHAHRSQIFGVSFSHDGKYFVTFSGSVGAGADNSARVWDVASGRQLAVLRHDVMVYHAAFSPDDKLIVTSELKGEDDAKNVPDATVWQWANGTKLHSLVDADSKKSVGFSSFSPGGTRIVTASTDGHIRIWDTYSGFLVATLKGHTASVERAFYAKSGDRIFSASEDGTGRIWDASAFSAKKILRDGSGPITVGSYSYDGSLVLTGSAAGTAQLWSTNSWAIVKSLPEQRGRIKFAFLSRDNRYAALIDGEGKLALIDVDSGKQIGPYHQISQIGVEACAAFSPDSKRLAFCTDNNVFIVDVSTGDVSVKIGDFTDFLSAVAFSPDGAVLATTTLDAHVQLSDALRGKIVRILDGHRLPAMHVAFSADGERIVTAGTDLTARVWDTKSGRELAVLRGHKSAVARSEFSPDGSLVLTHSDMTRVFDAKTGAVVRILNGGGANFSPSGRLVTGLSNNAGSLWDTASGGVLAQLRVDSDGLKSIFLAPNEHTVLSVAQNGLVYIFELSKLLDGDAFHVACGQLAERSFVHLAAVVGLDASLGICAGTEPLPAGDMIFQINKRWVGAKVGYEDAEALMFQRKFDEALQAIQDATLFGDHQQKLHASIVHAQILTLMGRIDAANRIWREQIGQVTFDYFEPDSEGVSHRFFERKALREIAETEKYFGTQEGFVEVKRLYEAKLAAIDSIGDHINSASDKFRNKDFDGAISEARRTVELINTADPAGQSPAHQFVKYTALYNLDSYAEEKGDKELMRASRLECAEVAKQLNQRYPNDVLWKYDYMKALYWLSEVSAPEDRRRHLVAAEKLAQALIVDSLAPVLNHQGWYSRISNDLYSSDMNVAEALVGAQKYDGAFEQAEETVARTRGATDAGLTDGTSLAVALNSLAWYAIFAKKFGVALESSAESIEKNSDVTKKLTSLTNRAHALMFLGRREEAMSIYLAERQKMMDGKTWEQVILEDFVAFRKVGLEHPLMQEVGKAFGETGDSP